MLPDSFSQATYRAENENEEFDSKHVTISIDEWESVSHDQILAHSFHIGGKRLPNTWFISESPSWSIYTCAQVAQHQTWKKARTRGHCPRKFLRIVEIFGLYKIIYSYCGGKPYRL